jgi:hypothetical protein
MLAAHPVPPESTIARPRKAPVLRVLAGRSLLAAREVARAAPLESSLRAHLLALRAALATTQAKQDKKRALLVLLVRRALLALTAADRVLWASFRLLDRVSAVPAHLESTLDLAQMPARRAPLAPTALHPEHGPASLALPESSRLRAQMPARRAKEVHTWTSLGQAAATPPQLEPSVEVAQLRTPVVPLAPTLDRGRVPAPAVLPELTQVNAHLLVPSVV